MKNKKKKLFTARVRTDDFLVVGIDAEDAIAVAELELNHVLADAMYSVELVSDDPIADKHALDQSLSGWPEDWIPYGARDDAAPWEEYLANARDESDEWTKVYKRIQCKLTKIHKTKKGKFKLHVIDLLGNDIRIKAPEKFVPENRFLDQHVVCHVKYEQHPGTKAHRGYVLINDVRLANTEYVLAKSVMDPY